MSRLKIRPRGYSLGAEITGVDLSKPLDAEIVDQIEKACIDHIVVFFPDTWQDDPASLFLNSGYHDVPWEQPNLVRVLMLPDRRERYGVWRLLRRVWLAVNAGRDGSR